jgi:hypothetical protein
LDSSVAVEQVKQNGKVFFFSRTGKSSGTPTAATPKVTGPFAEMETWPKYAPGLRVRSFPTGPHGSDPGSIGLEFTTR